jgi:hypothetical protein
MKVYYEVTATVPEKLAADFESYMIGIHIPDVLETGYFAAATIAKSDGRYKIRYEAHDRMALDQYLKKDAARLRTDFAEHFPEGVQVTREEWNKVARIEAPLFEA